MTKYKLPRGIKKYSKCLSYFPSLLATQIINPFLNSRTSANLGKAEGHSANGEHLIKGIETLLENLFYYLLKPIMILQILSRL